MNFRNKKDISLAQKKQKQKQKNWQSIQDRFRANIHFKALQRKHVL